ncbi:MAG TPA: hypothetical protein ENN51_05480 [candidate division WOR-3 bacterium]|uniref:Uncharacterized protein n=1 Tax=candidate division WOR-3 bacterium TaxID=2052148 RepID=A0A7V0T6G4_UNCW3|nr:hypothetical protein [candidate division WOR-3 bacterium]
MIRGRGRTSRPATGPDGIVYGMAIPAGLRDERGNCVHAAETTLVFTLDSLDARRLDREQFAAGLYIGLLPTDTFNFRTTDHLTVEALLTLRARVER